MRCLCSIACPAFESLEIRRLLSSNFSARINFQPDGTTVPDYYKADVGSTYGLRKNGLTYGWSADERSDTRARSLSKNPDQRYATLAQTQKNGASLSWEMAVPNGTYTVRVVAGDSDYIDSVLKMNVEGVLTVNGTPTSASHFIEGTKTVTVKDGRLTVSNAAGASNNKIDFIEIASGTSPIPVVRLAASDASASKGGDPGAFSATRIGDLSSSLTVDYTIGGSATNGVDYQTLSGDVTFNAGSSQAIIPVTPIQDASSEGTKTVSLKLATSSTYSLADKFSASVSIADDADVPVASGGTLKWTAVKTTAYRSEATGLVLNGKLYAFGGFVDSTYHPTARVDAYDPATDTWTRKADMPIGKTHMGIATDGKYIYLAGGYPADPVKGQTFATTSVLKYDPSSNTFSNFTPLPAARGGGNLQYLNGKLYYFSGSDASRNDRTELYSLDLTKPGAGWVQLASLPAARNHVAGAVLDGFIYAIGGQTGQDAAAVVRSDVWRYDPNKNTWTAVASLPSARSHILSSTFVMNGKIITTGGYGPGETALRDVDQYDPATNKWSALTSLPTSLGNGVGGSVNGKIVYAAAKGTSSFAGYIGTFSNNVVAGAVWSKGANAPYAIGEAAGGIINGKMYMVGAGPRYTIAYDLTTGTWKSGLAQRPLNGDHYGAEVVGGKLYLIGGLGSSSGAVQIYNPATNSWSRGANMPFAAGSVSTALINGLIYAAGGITGTSSSNYTGTGTTNQAAVYDPANNTWKMIASMPVGRNHAAAATDGNKLYIFGGRDGANKTTNGFNDVQIYDPATNTWVWDKTPGSGIPPLPQARGGMGKAVYGDGEFYVMGGETKNGAGATSQHVYDRVDIYNPVTRTWRSGPKMPTGRHGIFPLLYNNKIYVALGSPMAESGATNVLEILSLA